MTNGDVETRAKHGQWVTKVIGDEALSQSFSTREEAVEAGRTLAEQRATTHTVIDSELTGVITDEDEAARVSSVRESNRVDYRFLIIGGGMAADSAARGIRTVDEQGSIGIIAEEIDPPVTRPALTKKLWTDRAFSFDQVWLGTEADTGAIRHAGVRAVAIDRDARTVRGDDGVVYGYERLLLATGGSPRGLDLPDDERVIYFRSVDDYRTLRGFAGANRRIAVVGGSFIGTELAAALAQNDTRVTLIFPEKVLGGSVFPEFLAERFQNSYRTAGVSLVADSQLESGMVDAGMVRLRLSSDEFVEVDAVVVGVGVEPNVQIASDAGLEVGDGVVVDDRLRSSDPFIFAAGDIASYPDAILGRRRIEHVDNATAMGAQAGRNLAGADEPYDHTPYFYSVVLGNRYEAVGTLDSSLPNVLDWDERGGHGVVYYVDEDRVVGVLLWNVDGQRDAARKVIAEVSEVSRQSLLGLIPLPSPNDGA